MEKYRRYVHTDQTELWLFKSTGYSKQNFIQVRKILKYLLELSLPGGSEGAQEMAQPLNQ